MSGRSRANHCLYCGAVAVGWLDDFGRCKKCRLEDTVFETLRELSHAASWTMQARARLADSTHTLAVDAEPDFGPIESALQNARDRLARAINQKD